jgi:hypothetical protein
MEPIQLSANGIAMVSARIISISQNGRLLVKCDGDGLKISCLFVRTSAAAPPPMHLGTAVLCLIDGERGYVLGCVQPYRQEQPAPDRLHLTADNGIEMTCGQSSLSMNQSGEIVLSGTRINTRAKEDNKIQGATLLLN